MGLIIVLIVIGVIGYLYKSSPISDPAEVKRWYKNRPDEQKKVIRYFAVDGCLKKTISDQQYDEIVKSHVHKRDFKNEALDKIGLDESEVQEIEPVNFEGWAYDSEQFNNSFTKRGKDDNYRSSAYQVSWLFFSSTQVFLYRNTMHFDKDDKSILTEEYFYKDITNFATSTDTVETPYWDSKKNKVLMENIDSSRFAITVPGDKFYCALEQNDYTDRAIRAMKAKLREKKLE
ncbi:MAG: hypothetical protein R6T91_09190 [Bacteroidales bacterium]